MDLPPFPFVKSASHRSPEELQAGFEEDANPSLEVSLMGDAEPDFPLVAAGGDKALPIPAPTGDLLWNSTIEDEDWCVGQSGEDGGAGDDELQEEEDRGRQDRDRVLNDRATDSGPDAELDDRERDSETEAELDTREEREDESFLWGKGEGRKGEEETGLMRKSAGQDWQGGTSADFLPFERRGGKSESDESYKFGEKRMQSVGLDEEQEWNVRTKGRNEALDLDGNDDNVACLEEDLSRFAQPNAAQISGDEEDRARTPGGEKPGVSEEDKTGASDEANTGTSEEEKMSLVSREKAGKAGKASQKRKTSISLASVSGATNGDGQAETVVKKAKKKPVNVWAKTSSRKGGKKNSSRNGGQQNLAREDCVYITSVYRNQDKVEDGPNLSIVLSKYNKAEKVELSTDRLSAGSTKGYRMVRATRGVTDGTWYFEITVEKLGPTGHTRLGWSTQKGDVQAPVGFDSNSYAYRDVDGSKVHMAVREPYGEAYVEGDVIGFYINLPHGAELAPKPPPLVSYRGRPFLVETKEEPPKIVPGSEISFFRNGACQGVAFKDINAGRYFPAASMYTLPNEPNCTVRFNFGPEFQFPPIDIGDRPPPQAMSCAPYCGLDGQEAGPVAWASESHAVNASQTAESQKFGETG